MAATALVVGSAVATLIADEFRRVPSLALAPLASFLAGRRTPVDGEVRAKLDAAERPGGTRANERLRVVEHAGEHVDVLRRAEVD